MGDEHLGGTLAEGEPRRQRRRRRRGQSLIEMAFVMGVLLVLTFGMVDFGLFLTGYIRATNCAREVARAAVVRNASAVSVCGNEQLVPLFENVSVTLSNPNYMNANAGTPITVTIAATYRWRALATLINEFFPGNPWSGTTSTTSKATMRMEGQKT